jgi:hypothetical protein
MRLVLLAGLVAMLLSGPVAAQQGRDPERRSSQTWSDPDLGLALIEGVATRQDIWIRGYSGRVARFDRQTGARTVVAEDVVDLLPDGPHLWALIALTDSESIVRDLRQADVAERRISFQGNAVALFATEYGPGVLTTTRALTPSGNRWSRRLLAGAVDRYAHVSSRTGADLFVGYNRGEWGGGLRRIDLSTGAVFFVSEPGTDVCEGQLDPECSPVVGIVPDRQREDCVLVGASLAHLGGRYGEVLRVCGDVVSPVFAEALSGVPGSIESRPGQTWPFDSLVATEKGWVAVGQERFARSTDGIVRMDNVPPLRPWAGLQISDPVDDVIFAESACCWGSINVVQYRVMAIPVTD